MTTKLLYTVLTVTAIVGLALIAAGTSFLVNPHNFYTYGNNSTLNAGVVLWDNVIVEVKPEPALVFCYQIDWPVPDSMKVDC